MSRSTNVIVAAFFAALLGVIGLVPARAASIPTGPALGIEQNAKPAIEQVYHHRRYHRRHYRPARVYHRRVYHRPYPVYHRRCVTRPRTVWTPYGYVRRWVRVCRY